MLLVFFKKRALIARASAIVNSNVKIVRFAKPFQFGRVWRRLEANRSKFGRGVRF